MTALAQPPTHPSTAVPTTIPERVRQRAMATPDTSRRRASSDPAYIACIRSKLLGAPTSMALATVRTEFRGWYWPVRR